MKTRTALGDRVPHLPCALDLDFEHPACARACVARARCEACRSDAGVVRMFDEIAGCETPVELCVGEEVVGNAVLLPGARRARRREIDSPSSG